MREAARQRGDDPGLLPHRYAEFLNRLLEQKPPGMSVGVHLCRGNFKSTWAAEGGCEPVAEALFAEMNFDTYFLEYDDERSGDFQPFANEENAAGGRAGAGDLAIKAKDRPTILTISGLSKPQPNTPDSGNYCDCPNPWRYGLFLLDVRFDRSRLEDCFVLGKRGPVKRQEQARRN
jgi:hypothetical protein